MRSSVLALLFLVSVQAEVPTVDSNLFRRTRLSPRVLISAQPPGPQGPAVSRRSRQAGPQHRGMYSVCDSVSSWVGNKTNAIDIKGSEVTVLPDVKINNVTKKQYFFETTCHRSDSASGCLGIDSRHWNSHCTDSHSFVRALTAQDGRVAWRHIRIRVACVCVLSRKAWRQ